MQINNTVYAQQGCKNLEMQLAQLDAIVSAQRSQLQSDANLDVGIVAGSILFVPIALVALAATGNGDLKNQYAQNLGKQIAIREALVSGQCTREG